jgi:2-polyprenyl-6-methoxyphenol hydroxylase-like FAD-dependent oxidoreductase
VSSYSHSFDLHSTLVALNLRRCNRPLGGSDDSSLRHRQLSSRDIQLEAKSSTAFEDGTIASGYVLIGADGAHSSVRRLVKGSSASQITRLPYAATFIQACQTRSQALFLRSFHPSTLQLRTLHATSPSLGSKMPPAQTSPRRGRYSFIFPGRRPSRRKMLR